LYRYLQTLTTISTEKNSTIIFPLPMELLGTYMEVSGRLVCLLHNFKTLFALIPQLVKCRKDEATETEHIEESKDRQGNTQA
jgi:hypothetical protein